MGRPREFDIDEALRRAMDAFWAKGYEATSLADLTKAMGVQKASLYGTFGDKHKLFTAALTRYAHDGIERLRAELDRPEAPLDAVRGLFHTMVDNTVAPKGKRGCFCVNAAVELAPHDPAVGDIVREHVRGMEQVFAEALERAREAAGPQGRAAGPPKPPHSPAAGRRSSSTSPRQRSTSVTTSTTGTARASFLGG